MKNITIDSFLVGLVSAIDVIFIICQSTVFAYNPLLYLIQYLNRKSTLNSK